MHNKQKYHQYLKSQRWRGKTNAVKSRDRWRCRRCGIKNKSLHVHHLTYERIFKEPLTDLISLCRSCHAWIHKAGSVSHFVCPRWKKQTDLTMWRRLTRCQDDGRIFLLDDGAYKIDPFSLEDLKLCPHTSAHSIPAWRTFIRKATQHRFLITHVLDEKYSIIIKQLTN